MGIHQSYGSPPPPPPHMPKRLYSLILALRNRHLMLVDFLLLCVTPFAALVLRLESVNQIAGYERVLVLYTLFALLWKFAVFYPFGMYRRYWRFASVDDLLFLALSTSSSWLLGILLTLLVLRPLGILSALPRSIPVFDGALTMLCVGGVRLGLRIAFYLKETHSTTRPSERVLIAGAGLAGAMIVKELRTNPQLGAEMVGFLDDDPYKANLRIHGLPVLGTLKDLPEVSERLKITQVIVAMPTAPGHVVRDVVQACKTAGVKSKTIPGMFEILEGTAKIEEIRDVQIDDLLRRGTVETDTEGVGQTLRGARVLVTGAGGSIGSELCRQICQFDPEELVLLGHGENSIFQIAGELKKLYDKKTTPQVHTVVADIRDRARMEQVFQVYRPQVVFHAAAHKHVGLMEVNVADAVSNNVFGTRLVLDQAHRSGVDRFVMISSDKAVNPTSIMGVTKRIAELIVHEAATSTGRAYSSVRFGNVLGSRGSVVPIFKAQIASGGPVTVTHPEVSRFFLTIAEAVQLVLQAGSMGRGGEVFVLDMGEPVRILDLVRDMIRLSGLEEGMDIEIKFTGLKSGEKLHEELFYSWESHERSAHEKIFVHRGGSRPEVQSSSGWAENVSPLALDIERLVKAARQGASGEVQALFRRLVPEYVAGDETVSVRRPEAKGIGVPASGERPG